jgi:Protein of unknown function (DUF3768)
MANSDDGAPTGTAARVAELNDQLRKTLAGGRVMMTAGVQAIGPGFVAKVIAAAQQFTDFNPDNDPYGEHDFGAFEVDGHRLFFKIDAYAPDMQHGSEDPTDPAKTVRVLTLMLADEY